MSRKSDQRSAVSHKWYRAKSKIYLKAENLYLNPGDPVELSFERAAPMLAMGLLEEMTEQQPSQDGDSLDSGDQEPGTPEDKAEGD